MGFVVVGYPTKHHKRRRLPKVQFPVNLSNKSGKHKNVYRSNNDDINDKPRKKMKIPKSKSMMTQALHKQPTLNDLPPEIIEKIFIFANNLNGLPFINKYFHNCLKPTFHLYWNILWEQYSIIPFDYGYSNCFENISVLDYEIFKNRQMTLFFINNILTIQPLISGFVHNEQINQIKVKKIEASNDDRHDDDKSQLDFNNLKKLNLPQQLYFDIKEIFINNDLLLSFYFQYFTITNFDLLIENIIIWFFEENLKKERNSNNTDKVFKLTDLLKFFDIIKEKTQRQYSTVFTSRHLEAILDYLYLQNLSLNDIQFVSLFDGLIENEDNLAALKLKFIDLVIVTYYLFSNINNNNNNNNNHFENNAPNNDMNRNVLSNSSLWNRLREISDIDLLDAFIIRGIRPTFKDST